MISLTLNGKSLQIDADPDTPILWVLRDQLNLTGTKYGCGVAACGACVVHLDGAPVRACVTPIAAALGKQLATIEGMGGDPVGKALQDAWVKHNVPQCGYCQSGQIMSAAALLRSTRNPSNADIDAAMGGNLCRCGTYQRIRAAIQDTVLTLAGK